VRRVANKSDGDLVTINLREKRDRQQLSDGEIALRKSGDLTVTPKPEKKLDPTEKCGRAQIWIPLGWASGDC